MIIDTFIDVRGEAMGKTYAWIWIENIYTRKRKRLKLLVDTGATFTWIKRETLEELGIEPVRKERFELINGEIIERDVGEARVIYRDITGLTMVVFAEKDDKEVLGLMALESLGLYVHPSTGKLMREKALLAF